MSAFKSTQSLCSGYLRRKLPNVRISDIAAIVVQYFPMYEYNVKEIIGPGTYSEFEVVLGYRLDVEPHERVAIKIMYQMSKNADEKIVLYIN